MRTWQPTFTGALVAMTLAVTAQSAVAQRGGPLSDSAKAVRWGDQTWEEMMIGFIEYRAKTKE